MASQQRGQSGRTDARSGDFILSDTIAFRGRADHLDGRSGRRLVLEEVRPLRHRGQIAERRLEDDVRGNHQRRENG